MSIDKLTPLGENGSLESEATFEDWVDGGFVDERVRYTRLNRQFYRGDTKINEIIEGGVATAQDQTAHVLGIFPSSESAFSARDDGNVISCSDEVFDLSYTVINGSRYLLGCLSPQGGYGLMVYDIDALTETNVSDATLQAGLDVTGGSAYEPISVCNDGTWAYVLFWYTSPTPHEFYIQSYSLSDWSVNPSWPTTGLALNDDNTSGTWYGAYDYIWHARVRNIDSDRIAVTQPWCDYTTEPGVVAVGKSDGVVDYDIDHTDGPTYAIVSDGTSLYTAHDGSAGAGNIEVDKYVAATGAAGSWYWGDSSAYNSTSATFTGMACNGNSVLVSYTTALTLYNAAQGGTAKLTSSDADIYEITSAICSDGKEFWAAGERERYGTATNIGAVWRLDAARFAGYYTGADPFYEDFTALENWVTPFRFDTSSGGLLASAGRCMISDGDSIWIADNNDNLVRIRRAGYR